MTQEQPLRVQLSPKIADAAPQSEDLTPYDEAHLITYLRLLDAELAGADWRQAAKIVLGRDPETDEAGAQCCWRTHLARARWIARGGAIQLLAPED